jgi:magnesium transporter
MAETITNLESLVDHHLDEINDLITQNNPSVYEDYDSFQILRIRKISMTDSALTFIGEVFLIKEGQIYLYNSHQKGFLKLPKNYKMMLNLLMSYYVGNQKIINAYSVEIEKLEDSLFMRNIPSYFMDLWFDLKKDLAKIENFYYQNSVTYKEFFSRSEKSFRELTDEFKDIDDMIHFQMSNLVTLKARMDSLHHYYDSIKSDKLNKTLLALTLISGVFLPLNLIVGFFGMNTEGLFFKELPNGTNYVLFILAGIVGLALIGLPLVKLFDKYLLRFLLGRYDFYQSITKRIGKLDDHLKL